MTLWLRLLVLAIVLGCGAWTHGSPSCPQGTSLPDGCAGAPAVAAQYPNDLLTQVVVHVAAVGGSGYTNGTGYSWTSSGGGCLVASTGTVDVVSNALTNPVISTRGSGCTSIPIISIPAGAGAGTGGSLTATVFQVRPAQNVAGVDYGVGPPSTTSFKDPNTITTGANGCGTGCAVSAIVTVGSTKIVEITGGTLDSYDFTLNSCDWGVEVLAGTAWQISKSKFCRTVTNQQVPILVDAGASGGTITQNILDCNGVTVTTSNPGCITISGVSTSNTITVTYNWIKRAPIQAIATSGSHYIEEFNLLDQPGGINGGASHADIQLPGPATTIGDTYVAYEYWRQEDQGQNTGSRGYAWDNEGSGASITNSIEFDHIAANFLPNAAIDEIFEFSQQDTVVSINLHDSSFNPQGLRLNTSSAAASGHLYCNDAGTGGHSATLTNPNNNIDMTTGTSHAVFNAC